MYFGTNLRYLRKRAGYSQEDIAEKLGYKDYTTVQKWESDKSTPPMKKAQALADMFRVNIHDLVNKDLRPSLGTSLEELFKDVELPEPDNAIPIYENIPTNATDGKQKVIGHEAIPAKWTTEGQQYVAVRVSGDSMYPMYIDGDIIVVQLQDDCESGQDAIVYVKGYEATLKRVIKQPDGMIKLQPINPEFVPKVFNPDHIKILGVVKRLKRDF